MEHISKIKVRDYRRGNKKGQSRETGNIEYTRRRQTKQTHNTICVGKHYTQINTNNVNKTRAFIQTTRYMTEARFICSYCGMES